MQKIHKKDFMQGLYFFPHVLCLNCVGRQQQQQSQSPISKLDRPNTLLSKACMTVNFELKINWTCCFGFPLALSQCAVAVWPKWWLHLCTESLFTMFSSSGRTVYLETTPAPPKYTTGQNKNIFSGVIAGQTSVSLLDSAFTQQQIASDKRRGGLQISASEVLRA